MDKSFTEKHVSRRDFFRHSTGIAASALAAVTILPRSLQAAVPASAAVLKSGGNDTLTMTQDLRRALEKPMTMRKWAMVIDIRKCIGCSACSVACIAENNLPPGVTYRTVADVMHGDYPALQQIFMPTNCMQCEKAPCIEAANKTIPESMSRREDGIVVINHQKMKGRKVFTAATAVCPYPKSLWYDEGKNYSDGTPALQAYEKQQSVEIDKVIDRAATKGSTRKCHYCAHRIDAGLLPACISTCTGQAMHFGDLNDPESLVSQLLKSNKSARMAVAKGTEPGIHYVDKDPAQSCMICHQ